MKTKNFQISIFIKNVPSDDEMGVEMELMDVLRAINQLPYDYELKCKRDGSWL